LKKYLFVIDDLGPGGAQRQLVNLALELKRRGNDVSVLCYFNRDYYAKTLSENGIEAKFLIIKNPIKRIAGFRRYIRDGGFDVVISFLGVPNFICELASLPAKKWKLIVSERSADPRILLTFKSRLLRIFHFTADQIVTNSESNLLLIKKAGLFLDDSKLKVIYNSIDLDSWVPDRDYTPRKDGILNIVVAANYRYNKNLNGMLRALVNLNEKEKESLRIRWYGEGLSEPCFDESIKGDLAFIRENNLSSCVELYPQTQDIRNKMKDADIIALFSYFEGFPNAVCEGMALGKPIMASSVSDLTLVIENGVNGAIFDPNDTDSIVEAFRFFISADNETLERMGRESRIIAARLFDSKMNLEQFISLM
jgi:glycosyltransferase involved in cell wall biosynthesis